MGSLDTSCALLNKQKNLSSTKNRKMVLFRVFLTLLLASPSFSLFLGPPSKACRSDRDCPGLRRTTCEGRGPNFLLIFPTCGRFGPKNSYPQIILTPNNSNSVQNNFDAQMTIVFRERPYTVSGKCNVVPD